MKIRYNNKKAFNVKVINSSDNSAKNLTGYEARLMVKGSTGATEAILTLSGTIPAPETGIIEFVITPEQAKISPGKYVFDVQIRKPDGESWEDIQNNETEVFEVLPIVTT